MKACLNCKERYSGCHDECDKYKKEKMKIEQARIKRKEYYDSYSTIFNLSLNRR